MVDPLLEERVLNALRANPAGLNANATLSAIGPPAVTLEQLSAVINKLSAENSIELSHAQGQAAVFSLVSAADRALLSDVHDPDERLVVLHIRDAGNQGIWMKDLIKNTGLHRNVITKSIKTLEQRSKIKAVKSVKTPSRRIYMLATITPSVEITGGAWFTDQELDIQFVQALSQMCLNFIRGKLTPDMRAGKTLPSFTSTAQVSADDVQTYINGSGVTDVALARSDVEELLQMLVYDGQLEKIEITQGYEGRRTMYVPHPTTIGPGSNEAFRSDGWTDMPCGRCPVFDRCSANGRITPATCPYFEDWLRM